MPYQYRVQNVERLFQHDPLIPRGLARAHAWEPKTLVLNPLRTERPQAENFDSAKDLPAKAFVSTQELNGWKSFYRPPCRTVSSEVRL